MSNKWHLGRRGEFFCRLDIFFFPGPPRLDFPQSTLCDRVHVCPFVEFALLQESFVDEIVEVRIEAAMVDLLLVVAIEFGLSLRPVRLFEPGDYVQDIPLEPS